MKRFLNLFRPIHRGQPLRTVFTLEWATAVQDALTALAQGSNISVEGGLTATPGDGRVRLGVRGGPRALPPPPPPPLHVYGLRKDGEVWKVRVRPGHVRSVDPSSTADPVLRDLMVTLADVPLDDPAGPPELEVAAGDHVCVKITTDMKDRVETAELVALPDGTDEDTHYQPPPASTPGIYHWRLARISAVPDSDPEQLKIGPQLHTGLIPWRPNLWEGVNVGGQREIFQKRDTAADTYLFRSLEQLEGGQVPLIEPLDEGAEEGDTLKFRPFEVQTPFPAHFSKNGPVNQLVFTGTNVPYADGEGGSIAFSGGLATGVVPPPGVNSHFDIKYYGYQINYNGSLMVLEGDTTPHKTVYVRWGKQFLFLPAGAPASTGTLNLYVRPVTFGANNTNMLNTWVPIGPGE